MGLKNSNEERRANILSRHARTFGWIALCVACEWTRSACGRELNSQLSEKDFAFLSERHGKTVDTNGPYRIHLRQVLGAEVVGGSLLYSTLANAASRPGREARVPLQRGQDGRSWNAEIPGQPAGTTIVYHFLLTSRSGQVLRHPARTPARYRFEVVPALPLGVTLTRATSPAAPGFRVQLRLRSPTRPAGTLVARLLSSTAVPRERRVALANSPGSHAGRGPSSLWKLGAALPELKPGEIADFYFEITLANGAAFKVPADAPAQAYSVKQSLRKVETFVSESPGVTDMAQTGRERWIGLATGGLWRQDRKANSRSWTAVQGLPSANVQFVEPASESGRAFVGTDRGVVAVSAEGELPLMLVGPQRPLPGSVPAGGGLPAWEFQVGPAALSALDGSLLFELHPQPAGEPQTAKAKLLEWSEGHLTQWRLAVPLVRLSTVTFDAVEGCWLLGGFEARGDDVQPVLIRRCGRHVETDTLAPFPVGQSHGVPQRIIAITRDPTTNALLLALEFRRADEPRQEPHFGVYRLEETSGRSSPLAFELADLQTAITALSTDWLRHRVLVGTDGRGLFAVSGGAVTLLTPDHRLPESITSLAVNPVTGTLMIGTVEGAFESRKSSVEPIALPNGEALPADSLPMDFRPQEKCLLLSSYRGGLSVLHRGRARGSRALQRLRPGRELPDGLFGEAKYTSAGEIVAILHSQGLLRVHTNLQTSLLRTNDGLYSARLLQLLARRSGQVWVAHTPIPSGPRPGGAVQMLRDDEVTRTVPIANRDLATISRWLEVPERDSVFAATRAGVAEIAEDGAITLLTTDPVSAIARDPQTGALGVAGTVVARWDGEQFSPVLFAVNHPRWPRGRFYLGNPIDLAIDSDGVWYLLFPGGYLVLLDRQGNTIGLLDSEDGLPATAQRLLLVPETGELFVGSAEGLSAVELIPRSK